MTLAMSPDLAAAEVHHAAHQPVVRPAGVTTVALPPMLRSRLNGRCLDADLTNIGHNGTRVQLWRCNGQSQQRWSSGTNAQVNNYADGRCLDADLLTIGQNGTKIQLWDCNYENQQKFYYSGSTFRIAYNGKCLDADTLTADRDGGRVQLWDCNGSVQQQWDIVP